MSTSNEKSELRWYGLIIAVLLGLALILVWFFVDQFQKNKIKDKIIANLQDENEELRRAYLDLLQRFLILDNKTTPDIIQELERLKDAVIHLDKNIHIELKSVITLAEAGMYSKAVKDLAKIVENILKDKVKLDQTFTKKPMLANLLDHAKNCNWIQPNEYAYGELLREIRNKESHEVNVQVEPHRIGLAIFSGIQIIYSLSQTSNRVV